MWPDVVDMRDFYATPLGQMVRVMIRRRIREFWPDLKKKDVLAVGYATPFIRTYQETAKHLVVVMPAEQGALSWSRKTPNVVTLADEYALPLPDKSVDYVLLSHTLEFTQYPHAVLREAWRVLADGGRVLLVVPSRSGIWARTDRTPFGQGRPYSVNQVKKLLKENMFTPQGQKHALAFPPVESRVMLSMARAWEKIGEKWFSHVSGVLLVEASKQVYAGLPIPEKAWSKKVKLKKAFVIHPKN